MNRDLTIAAVPVALLSIAVGVTGIVSPDGAMTLRRLYFATPGLFYAVVAVHVTTGLGLILAASNSRWPRTLRALGAAVCLQGLSAVLLGFDRARAIMEWEGIQGPALLRAGAALALACGTFIVFAIGRSQKSVPSTGWIQRRCSNNSGRAPSSQESQMRRLIVCAMAIAASAAVMHAQWLNYPTPGVPRLPNGKVNLAAKAPRTFDGKPDLSGVWHNEITPVEEWRRRIGDAAVSAQLASTITGMGIDTISIYATNLMMDLPREQQEQLLRPAAVEKMRQPQSLPSERCLPLEFPMATLLTPVTKLIQSPAMLVMLLEEGNTYRQIYLDGRPLPKDPQPTWIGYSTGHWENDTLVVETNGLNDKTFLDFVGHPRSESMHMTERYRRPDVGHLDVQLTFDDPVYYTKPWGLTVHHVLQADSDILEYICNENEKDRAHMGR